MSQTILPNGACTAERLRELAAMAPQEKRMKRLYWVTPSTKELGASYIIDSDISYYKDHHLNLAWEGPLFENYFYAFAYWLRETEHLRNITSA